MEKLIMHWAELKTNNRDKPKIYIAAPELVFKGLFQVEALICQSRWKWHCWNLYGSYMLSMISELPGQL